MKEKPSTEEKEAQESTGLKTAGAEGEITAGMHAMLLPGFNIHHTYFFQLFMKAF